MSIISISDFNRKFGQNERVVFTFIREEDGFKAISDNDMFEVKATGFNELRMWLRDNIPNYRSNEHEFWNMRNQP